MTLSRLLVDLNWDPKISSPFFVWHTRPTARPPGRPAARPPARPAARPLARLPARKLTCWPAQPAGPAKYRRATFENEKWAT